MVDQIGSGNIRAIMKSKPMGDKDAKKEKKNREEHEEERPQKSSEGSHLGVNIDEQC